MACRHRIGSGRDGTILVKLAWRHEQSREFGRFIDGKPVDEAQHRTCFPCHSANVRNHDIVFTRFTP